jgi:hypothetical protein
MFMKRIMNDSGSEFKLFRPGAGAEFLRRREAGALVGALRQETPFDLSGGVPNDGFPRPRRPTPEWAVAPAGYPGRGRWDAAALHDIGRDYVAERLAHQHGTKVRAGYLEVVRRRPT